MKDSLLDMNVLLKAVGGVSVRANCAADKSCEDCGFNSVVTDSRFVLKDSLFVPLIGEFQNGHKYIPQALEKGASLVFINRSEYDAAQGLYDGLLEQYSLADFILVDNTLYALQAAAAAYAEKTASNMIRISVTGSSGKTTTKEMLVNVCKAYFGEDKVCYTKGNFNSETGLPLSMFQIKGDEKVGVFEMGMNRLNEIGEISAVWKSQYGIITNIGNAHIGILGSRENIAREKRKSFDYIPAEGAAFVPANDDFADFCTLNVKGKVVRYGKTVPENESGVHFISDMGLAGTKFSIDGVEINLPLAGDYNYENALGVVAVARELGIPAQKIKQGLEAMSAVNGRMEVKKTALVNGAQITLICDCYNANPDSMQKVIDYVGKTEQTGKKIFVLGDMKELGDKSESAHSEIGKAIEKAGASLAILTGPEMKAAVKTAGSVPVLYFEKNDDAFYEQAADKILSFAGDGDVILIKGSHSMALEKTIPLICGNKQEVQ